MARYNCILVISDMHIPYEHQDSFDFLTAIKKKYDIDRVVNIGDELDCHALSFHDADPDLYSSGHELEEAKIHIRKLEKISDGVSKPVVLGEVQKNVKMN